MHISRNTISSRGRSGPRTVREVIREKESSNENRIAARSLCRRTQGPLQRRATACESAAQNGQGGFILGVERGLRRTPRRNARARRAAGKNLQESRHEPEGQEMQGDGV